MDRAFAFQSFGHDVTTQIKSRFALFIVGVHCMDHKTDLAVHTLSGMPFINRMEDFLNMLYSFFCKSPKRHLDFVKLGILMDYKES